MTRTYAYGTPGRVSTNKDNKALTINREQRGTSIKESRRATVTKALDDLSDLVSAGSAGAVLVMAAPASPVVLAGAWTALTIYASWRLSGFVVNAMSAATGDPAMSEAFEAAKAPMDLKDITKSYYNKGLEEIERKGQIAGDERRCYVAFGEFSLDLAFMIPMGSSDSVKAARKIIVAQNVSDILQGASAGLKGSEMLRLSEPLLKRTTDTTAQLVEAARQQVQEIQLMLETQRNGQKLVEQAKAE